MHDSSDDLMITENTSAAMNWNDEPNKDKMFTLRNFECDANIYINIKEALNSGTAETQHKVANLVKRISLLKQKRNAPQRAPSPPHAPAQAPVQMSSPALAAALAGSTATPPPPVNGFAYGRGAQNHQQPLSVRKLSTMQQTPVQTQLLQSALARHNGPTMMPASIASAPVASVQNTLNAPSNMPQSPQVACAPQRTPQPTPLANMQPIAYAPNASNAPNAPTLLDLPQRVRLRNRAYSIHYAPNEQIPSQIIARRQSYGNGLLTPLPSLQVAIACSPSADATAASSTAAAQQPDHTYTMSNSANFHSQNGQRPTPPPPPFMTHIHAREIAATPKPPTQLKVLTPDDLNSRKYINTSTLCTVAVL